MTPNKLTAGLLNRGPGGPWKTKASFSPPSPLFLSLTSAHPTLPGTWHPPLAKPRALSFAFVLVQMSRDPRPGGPVVRGVQGVPHPSPGRQGPRGLGWGRLPARMCSPPPRCGARSLRTARQRRRRGHRGRHPQLRRGPGVQPRRHTHQLPAPAAPEAPTHAARPGPQAPGRTQART